MEDWTLKKSKGEQRMEWDYEMPPTREWDLIRYKQECVFALLPRKCVDGKVRWLCSVWVRLDYSHRGGYWSEFGLASPVPFDGEALVCRRPPAPKSGR